MTKEQKLAILSDNEEKIKEIRDIQAAEYSEDNWRGKYTHPEDIQNAFKAGFNFFASQLDAAILITKEEENNETQ